MIVKDILDSAFIKKYKKDMIQSILLMKPDMDKSKIESTLDKMILENFKTPSVTLDNNYTHETRETTLVSVFDWILKRNPIIAGNGTFYKNQHEAMNPIAKMLDNFAASRSQFKKEMFKVDDTDSYEYKELDRSQLNEKINMNSWYGGSGAPSSAFYSKWSGPATTLTAQSVISTATAMFDSFLVDNQYFLDMTELSFWLKVVLKEFEDIGCELDDFIVPCSKMKLINRLNSKMLNYEENSEINEIMIENIVSNLTPAQITFVYYKNNMVEFIANHKEIASLFEEILWSCHSYPMIAVNKKGEYDGTCEHWYDEVPVEFRDDYKHKHVKDWNKFVSKEYFMDPNKIPDTIKEYVIKLKEYFMKYVYVKYLSFDRIYRLRNFKRKTAVIIDTDSNILTLDIIMRYILDHIVKNETYGRENEYNIFIIVNTLTATITEAIRTTLLYYGEASYIPEDYRPRFDMKNEFFMSPVIIGDAKKRYVSKIILREGNLLNPAKIDIKGFDFKKATCSEYSEKYFMGVIRKHIIEPDNVNIPGMYNDIKQFEKEIVESIHNGENKFLPNASVKELAGYKDPASEQSVRGYLAWNILRPDNLIEAPAKVSLIKMNIFTLDDCKSLEHTNPDIYELIKEKIFNDKTGIFVTKKKIADFKRVSLRDSDWLSKIPTKYKKSFKDKTAKEWNEYVDMMGTQYEYKYRGLQVLAIPRNDRIPEWALPYVDMTNMVNTIISPFRPVMKLFGNQTAIEGKMISGVNRTTEKITNIVKF